MARYAIITPPLAGHINALTALGEALVARGHAVDLLGPPDAARWLERTRVGFVPMGEADYPPGALERNARNMGALRGLIGVRRMIADLARMTDMVCREAPALLEDYDGAIVDQLEPGGALAAEAIGLPFVSVATALHVNRDADVPPPFVGWRYDPTDYGRWKVRGAYRISDRMMAPIGDVLAHHCRRFGLRVRRDAAEFASPLADLSQCPRALDYPHAALPGTHHAVGPLRRPDPRPMPDLSGLRPDRPLAFCSLGTLQGARRPLFRRIAAAADDLGLNLVLVHCGRLDPRDADALPGSPVVTDFVPQDRVLERADVAILHGGFNTVLDALVARTPIVAIPLAMEQPAIAARLERAGLGTRLSPHGLTRGRIRRAIRAVLEDRDMPDRLDRMAGEIARAGGAARAAALVEAATLARAPALREPADA